MTVAGELILGRSFEAPDETRTYYKLVVELVSLGELIVSRQPARLRAGLALV